MAIEFLPDIPQFLDVITDVEQAEQARMRAETRLKAHQRAVKQMNEGGFIRFAYIIRPRHNLDELRAQHFASRSRGTIFRHEEEKVSIDRPFIATEFQLRRDSPDHPLHYTYKGPTPPSVNPLGRWFKDLTSLTDYWRVRVPPAALHAIEITPITLQLHEMLGGTALGQLTEALRQR